MSNDANTPLVYNEEGWNRQHQVFVCMCVCVCVLHLGNETRRIVDKSDKNITLILNKMYRYSSSAQMC